MRDTVVQSNSLECELTWVCYTCALTKLRGRNNLLQNLFPIKRDREDLLAYSNRFLFQKFRFVGMSVTIAKQGYLQILVKIRSTSPQLKNYIRKLCGLVFQTSINVRPTKAFNAFERMYLIEITKYSVSYSVRTWLITMNVFIYMYKGIILYFDSHRKHRVCKS